MGSSAMLLLLLSGGDGFGVELGVGLMTLKSGTENVEEVESRLNMGQKA